MTLLLSEILLSSCPVNISYSSPYEQFTSAENNIKKLIRLLISEIECLKKINFFCLIFTARCNAGHSYATVCCPSAVSVCDVQVL